MNESVEGQQQELQSSVDAVAASVEELMLKDEYVNDEYWLIL